MNTHDATENAYKNGYQKGKADAAKEIFEEIDKEINEALKNNYNVMREHNIKHSPKTDGLFLERVNGKIDTLRGIGDFVDELKKKYMEGNP